MSARAPAGLAKLRAFVGNNREWLICQRWSKHLLGMTLQDACRLGERFGQSGDPRGVPLAVALTAIAAGVKCGIPEPTTLRELSELGVAVLQDPAPEGPATTG